MGLNFDYTWKEALQVILQILPIFHDMLLNWSVLANNSCKATWTNSSEKKPDLGVDQDQQYRTTLKIECKADRPDSYQVIWDVTEGAWGKKF